MGSTTVCVVGLGYIGLPTAAILASNGVDVIGVDINERTVEAVNRGDVPFVEPDLATYVAGAVTQGTLRAATKPEQADAFIVAVPTPFTDGHKPDLSYIQAAAEAIAPHLAADALVILESTSPPQATQQMAEWILAARPDLSLDATLLRFAEREHRYTDFVMGPTIVATRDLAERVKFAAVARGEDTGFLRSAVDAGARVFSADRYNFVQVRAGAAHTWDVTDAELLASGEVQFYGRADQHVLV